MSTQPSADTSQNARSRLWLLLAGMGIIPVLLIEVLRPIAERAIPGSSIWLILAVIGLTPLIGWWLSGLQYGPNFTALAAEQQRFAGRVAAGDLTARLNLDMFRDSANFFHMATELNHMVESVHSVVS